MPPPSKAVLTAILLEALAGVLTFAWIVLFTGFITMLSSRVTGLFFLLAPMLGAVAFGLSLAIRFLAVDARGRAIMSVATILFAATAVLLFLPNWNWYNPSYYCTGCMEFFYLPALGAGAAGAGLVVEAVGIWRWHREDRTSGARGL